MTRKASMTYNITAISISVAVITICAWIHIPLIVSVTLQSLAIFLIASLLPLKIAVWGICMYLVLGAIGLPVFSGFNGGIAVFF